MNAMDPKDILEELRKKRTPATERASESIPVGQPPAADTKIDYEALLLQRAEQLRQAMMDLDRSHDLVLEAYGDCLETRDTEIAAHSKRVTAFSIALSRAMGLPVGSIRAVARAAFLHDIGKLKLPDAILRDPNSLTDGEMQILREHCVHGYKMLQKISFLSEEAEIVYAHHEHWDGSGYPRGLKELVIPLGARIVAVVNVFDHLCSGQPSSPAQPSEIAARGIKDFSGKQFDPDVVNAFLTIPVSVWHDLRKEIRNRR